MKSQLDATDKKLLNILQRDARLELRKIAKLIGKTLSPTHDRIKKLERLGYIEKYVAVVNREKIGWPVLAIIRVSLTVNKQETFTDFEQTITDFDEVLQCIQTTGDCDFILHAAFSDMNAYHHFLISRLCSLSYIVHNGTSFMLKESKALQPLIL